MHATVRKLGTGGVVGKSEGEFLHGRVDKFLLFGACERVAVNVLGTLANTCGTQVGDKNFWEIFIFLYFFYFFDMAGTDRNTSRGMVDVVIFYFVKPKVKIGQKCGERMANACYACQTTLGCMAHFINFVNFWFGGNTGERAGDAGEHAGNTV